MVWVRFRMRYRSAPHKQRITLGCGFREVGSTLKTLSFKEQSIVPLGIPWLACLALVLLSLGAISQPMQAFTIRPRPSKEVAWCNASYDSIRGRIVSQWKSEGNKFTLSITIPANTTTTVIIPATNPDVVTESGRLATKSEGFTRLRSKPGAVVYRVGSGNYQFISLITSK